MDRRHECETACERDVAEPCQPRLAEPLDHSPKDAGANHESHAAQIHDEEPDVCFSDGKSVGKNQRQRWSGSIKSADTDRIDPDQSLRRLLWMGDDTPHRARTGLRNDLVLGGQGAVARLTQIDASEDTDQNAEYC